MKKIALLILSLFIFSTYSQGALALSNARGSDPTGQSQRSIIEKTPWLDPTACVTGGGSATATASGGKVYILGDSITANTQFVQNKITESLKAKSYDPIYNSVSSRSLTSGPSELNGISVFEADTARWKSAGTIIIELGTNGGVTQDNIKKIIDLIKSNSPSAKVYWVNVGVNNDKRSGTDINADSINTTLSQNSTLGYDVIDWASALKSNPNFINDDGLGVHPFTTDGGQAYANTISSSLGSSASTTTLSGACSCQSLSGGGGAVNLTGNENRDKVWNYLISKGLTPFQAAGMMGNMAAEAHFEPRLVEYAFSSPPHLSDTVPPNQNSNGQPGYGIVQFTSPGYKQALRDRSAQTGKIAGDLGLQLDYLWELLMSKPWGTSLRATTTINDASDVFLKEFEIPSDIAGQIPIRRANAEKIFNKYSGSVAVTSNTSTANQGCGSAISQGSTASVVLVAQQELAAYTGIGGDKYILGSDKSIPWCAAFVSYVLKQAGVTFTGGAGENGYYIPSVASVRSYFEASPNTYHPARSGYVPQPGDIVIFQEGIEPWASHVNIVISVDGSKMTTIGGNEGNKVSQNVISNYNDPYITGFGTPKGVK